MGNSRILQDADNQITSPHGDGRNHQGIDLVKNVGQLAYITAHSDGVVEFVRDSISGFLPNSYGNEIWIRHNSRERTHYSHIQYQSITVSVGQTVSKGQVIGYMGATGTAYGAHLDFEYEVDGVKVDPTPIISGDLINGPATATPATNPINTGIVKGNKIKLNGSAVIYGQSEGFADEVYKNIYDVIEVSGDRVVFGVGSAVTGAVSSSSCVLIGNTPTPIVSTQIMGVGSKIRIKSNANIYGQSEGFASFVYETIYDVIEVSDDRVVFGLGAAVTGAVYIADCILV